MDVLSKITNNERKKYSIAGIPILSFFSGGGFLDLGFQQAGFEIVWANESNPTFADMYEYGTTSWRNSFYTNPERAVISDRRSIIEITAREIIKKAFPNGKPRLFGIIGGPPCPDFANGGRNRGCTGDNGKLSQIYVDRICDIKPDFFLFENVPGLLRTKKHRDFLLQLEDQLMANGYCLDLRVLNSLEMGLPQNRERVILIGVKKKLLKKCLGKNLDINDRGWFPWPEFPEYKDAKKRFDWPTVVLKGIDVQKPEGIPDELTLFHLLDGKNPPSKQPNGLEGFKPRSNKFNYICEGDTTRKSFKRLHRYRYSPTACYGHNEVHIHPWENRRLTVREAMRIQGIPDTYVLPSNASLSAKFSIIGNAVPVPLAKNVAIALFDLLKAT